jgi:hypothetical protein
MRIILIKMPSKSGIEIITFVVSQPGRHDPLGMAVAYLKVLPWIAINLIYFYSLRI